MRKYNFLAVVALLQLGWLSSGVLAAVILSEEQENNDGFFVRNVLPAGATQFAGTLTAPLSEFVVDPSGPMFAPHGESGPYVLYVQLGTQNPESLVEGNSYNGTADIVRASTLEFDQADFYSLQTTDFGSSFIAGQEFVAVIDNQPSGGADFPPDLTLGWLSAPEVGAVIDTDDDSSPLGNGLAPTISGTVDGQGRINLGVSGFSDFDFDGFDDDQVAGDVDFVSFQGLVPGSNFMARVSSDNANLDAVLGAFDERGRLIAANDDFGPSFLPALIGIVPASGTLSFAVSGFGDNAFEGAHDQSGEYILTVTDDLADELTLPVEQDGSFLFRGLNVQESVPVLLDPEVAVGYEYVLDDLGTGIDFESIYLPSLPGDSEYLVTYLDPNAGEVTRLATAGELFAFPFNSSVQRFMVTGINPAEMLDPLDPKAFVVAVTFNGTGRVNVTQTPISANFVPEPGAFALVFAVACMACYPVYRFRRPTIHG